MLQRALLPGLLLLLSGATFAQDEKKPTYRDLLGRVKKSDAKVDFTALRTAYTQTPDYNPYDDDRESRDEMSDAFARKDFQNAVKQADKLLSKNYVDPEAHRVAASAHAELKNNEQAKFHSYVRDGLVQSLLKSGDGKSPKTAYVVIATSEEYALMHALGVRPLRQALMQEQGHRYDRQDGEDEKKQPITIYFNIDRPFQWLDDSFKKKD
jgi:hypothetical protein